eukprot:761979-Hanusia_phi.AAC.2
MLCVRGRERLQDLDLLGVRGVGHKHLKHVVYPLERERLRDGSQDQAKQKGREGGTRGCGGGEGAGGRREGEERRGKQLDLEVGQHARDVGPDHFVLL